VAGEGSPVIGGRAASADPREARHRLRQRESATMRSGQPHARDVARERRICAPASTLVSPPGQPRKRGQGAITTGEPENKGRPHKGGPTLTPQRTTIRHTKLG